MAYVNSFMLPMTDRFVVRERGALLHASVCWSWNLVDSVLCSLDESVEQLALRRERNDHAEKRAFVGAEYEMTRTGRHDPRVPVAQLS